MIRLRVDEPEVIRLRIEEKVVIVDPSSIDTYDGDYVIDPDFDGRVLLTNQKRMTDDVTINPIEVARTTNPAGGKTVYIGGII